MKDKFIVQRPKKLTKISLRLPESLLQKLDCAARQLHCTRTERIVKAVDYALKRLNHKKK